jgi:hypothetical protein
MPVGKNLLFLSLLLQSAFSLPMVSFARSEVV